MYSFISFLENNSDWILEELKVTSQLDAHVYTCERSEFNTTDDCTQFSTIM